DSVSTLKPTFKVLILITCLITISLCPYSVTSSDFPSHYWPPEEGGGEHEFKLLHKKCDAETDESEEFKTAKEAAFAAMEKKFEEGAIGFCKEEIEHVEVEAECERGLKAHDCGECVKAAAEIAEEKCGGSVSGEVYLDRCFLSYSYDPEESSDDSESATAKTIALAVGGTAAFV
ncbi:Plasmodesmata-located protein 4, partial [Linum grandiflorum]